MKKLFIYILMSFVTITSFAQSDQKSSKSAKKLEMQKAKAALKAEQKRLAAEKKQAEDALAYTKTPGKVYVYGCSFEFGDSMMYVTSISEIDSMILTKKTNFLPYRSDFSQQLKESLENGERKLSRQTTSVFFSKDKAKLKKQCEKLKKRCLKKGNVKIYTLGESEFTFVHPLDYNKVSQ